MSEQTNTDSPQVDNDDAWSDEDLSDLSRASLLYSAQMLGEEDYDDTW